MFYPILLGKREPRLLHFRCTYFTVKWKILFNVLQSWEFKKDFYLSDIFDDIIIGIPISKLIERGFLVPDENYIIPVDENDFKFDSFGEVSNSEEVFDVKFQMDVLQNYLQFCKGKKTTIILIIIKIL